MTTDARPALALIVAVLLAGCSAPAEPTPPKAAPPASSQVIDPFKPPSAEQVADAKAHLARFGPADPRKPRDWMESSPVVIVSSAGVSVGRWDETYVAPVGLKDLPAALVTLPADAWPNGRLVTLTEPGVGGLPDTDPDEQEIAMTRAVLEAMDVRVSRPPL